MFCMELPKKKSLEKVADGKAAHFTFQHWGMEYKNMVKKMLSLHVIRMKDFMLHRNMRSRHKFGKCIQQSYILLSAVSTTGTHHPPDPR